MADSPWAGRTLTKGQVIQRLKGLGCHEMERLSEATAMWQAPTGQYFSVSYAECDDKMIEGILNQLQKWADEKKQP